MAQRPKLPTAVWSAHGPVAIRTVSTNDDAFGCWLPAERVIQLDELPHIHNRIPTLFHEMTHVALFDSGVQNMLTKEQLEGVCDAMGLYLSGAYNAGCLTLKAPKEATDDN